MKIAAFDLSLTSTGYAIAGFGEGQFAGTFPLALDVGTLPNKLAGPQRLAWIRDRVLELAQDADLVVLEGYAHGRIQRAHHLGELGGVVRLALFERGLPVVDVAPSLLKQYAVANGNAAKEQMLVAAVKRLQYDGASHDEADALWLLHMAAAACGRAWVALPAAQCKVVDKVSWPIRLEVVHA